MENDTGVIRVRCRQNAYYRNQMREKGSVVNFYTEDMDKGVYKAGDKIGQPKPAMPRWAEVVEVSTPLTVPPSQEEMNTLSQLSGKGTPAQQKAAEKAQKKLDEDRAKFEEEKAAFEKKAEKKKIYQEH